MAQGGNNLQGTLPIRIQLDLFPELAGFLSIKIFRIYPDMYPDISGKYLAFFNGYYHYKKRKKLYSR